MRAREEAAGSRSEIGSDGGHGGDGGHNDNDDFAGRPFVTSEEKE